MRTIASLILTLVASAAIGVVMALMDKFSFYLVFAVPIIGGTIIGAAAALPVGERRMPKFPLVFIALLGAILAQGVYWGGQYLTYREVIATEISAEFPEVTREDIFTLIDEAGGFTGFVQLYAEEGMSITRFGSSSNSGVKLQGTALYLFWAAEVLVMAAAAIARATQNKQEEEIESVPAMA